MYKQVAPKRDTLVPGVERIHPSVCSWQKRLLDIMGGLVGLSLLSAIFLPIAIAIRLDSPGPILYRQKRCGVRGHPFVLYKFRTMVHNADALKPFVQNQARGHIFKNKQDPRITRVGKFLRRTSLDECPQFWNVLRGEMSLVGTRPPTLDEVAKYSTYHWKRLNVKPGITGEWQVNGRSIVTDFDDIVALDLKYQFLWSVRRDLLLIWKTFFVLVGGVGSF